MYDKLCRKLESGENLRILEYLEMGVAKWLNSATWNAAPRFPLTDLHQNRSPGVSWPVMQKSLKGHYEKRNRKSAILHLVAILAIFHIFTLTYLS